MAKEYLDIKKEGGNYYLELHWPLGIIRLAKFKSCMSSGLFADLAKRGIKMHEQNND